MKSSINDPCNERCQNHSFLLLSKISPWPSHLFTCLSKTLLCYLVSKNFTEAFFHCLLRSYDFFYVLILYWQIFHLLSIHLSPWSYTHSNMSNVHSIYYPFYENFTEAFYHFLLGSDHTFLFPTPFFTRWIYYISTLILIRFWYILTSCMLPRHR